ncbi:metallophosphoesterase family protein [Candidatus Latescibacterota bacterium]
MKRRSFIAAASTGIATFTAGACTKVPVPPERKKLFSFIHFTDTHMQPTMGAREGFLLAIEKMNSIKPDFVVSGGDLVTDVLAADEERADMLYNLSLECCKSFEVPIYHVIGNHEIFGINVPDKVPEDHPEWGKEMFKKRIGEGATYRSFDHKGVHFLLLDSMGIEKNEDKPGYQYIGEIGREQLTWIEQDLAGLPANTPVIAVSHIPLLTLVMQIKHGLMWQNPKTHVITDGIDLYNLISHYRLFGFLYGHHHANETYIYKGQKFIETGAISGGWWGGDHIGHPEGFNWIDVYEDGIETKYITYGWDASKFTSGV